jgi:AcrR family transcriptional regulator
MQDGSEEAVASVLPPFPPMHVEAEPGDATRVRGPYRKTRETRARILAAAMEVFAARGFHSGSLREIGERAGLDQTSILHHFPSKSALLLAVMEERDRRADELIARRHPTSLADVPGAVLALAEHNVDTPGVIELYSLLAAESVTADHPLADYFRDRTRRVRTGFTRWFAELDREGLLRDGVTAEFAATAFFGLWEGAQLHWLIDEPGVDVVETLRDFLRLVIRPGLPAADATPDDREDDDEHETA